jgi:hypothetical protein
MVAFNVLVASDLFTPASTWSGRSKVVRSSQRVEQRFRALQAGAVEVFGEINCRSRAKSS